MDPMQFSDLGARTASMSSDSIVKFLAWFHSEYQTVGVLLILMGADVITGIFAGAIKGQLSSRVSWIGMCKKVIMLMAVGLGNVMEPYASGLPLGKLCAVFYSFTEGISIVENMGRAGVPIPGPLRDALANLGAGQNGKVPDKPNTNP